jgi:hypothetical protein
LVVCGEQFCFVSKLTVEWGEATAPDGNIEVTVLPEAGLVTVIPGLLIKGNATELEVQGVCWRLRM